jgi:DNA-binding NarL/FixJ family response regulator
LEEILQKTGVANTSFGGELARRLSTVVFRGVDFAMKALTKREKGISLYLIRGFTNKQIARELGISTHTVRDYISSMLIKFSVRNRVELAISCTKLPDPMGKPLGVGSIDPLKAGEQAA